MRVISLIGYILILVVLGAALIQNRTLRADLNEEAASRYLPKLGETVPIIALQGIDGTYIELGTAPKRGRQLIVHLSSTCPSSRRTAPFIREISNALGREGVQVVGVTTEPDATELRAYLKEFGLDFSVAAGVAQRDIRAFRMLMTPMILAVSENGTIEALKIGAIESNEEAFDIVRRALPMEGERALNTIGET